jgi:hypothetical protein
MKNKTGILIFCFVLELLLLFYFRNEVGFVVSPILMTTAGFTLAILPYFLFKTGEIKEISRIRTFKFDAKISIRLTYLIQIFLLAVVWIWAIYLFKKYPIDITHSDILPFINDILLKRFFGGENVYALVQGFNHYPHAFTPNYFPFHWIPFSLSYLLQIDLRFTVLIVFSIVSIFHIFINIGHSSISILKLILLQAPVLVVLSILAKQGPDFASNIEVLIMSYYLFLANSIFFLNPIGKAFGLCFPFLSRYAFLFWIPSYFYALLRDKFKLFLWTGIVFAVLILLFFVYPFVRVNPEILKQSSDIYIDGAMGEWKGQSWQNPGDKPFQLFQGMGFASWFYTWMDGELKDKIIFLKSFLMWMCLISAILPVLFHKKAMKYLSPRWFSLLALKFCLTVFYAFILVPYLYLFWVPLMVSAVILIKALNEGENAVLNESPIS